MAPPAEALVDHIDIRMFAIDLESMCSSVSDPQSPGHGAIEEVILLQMRSPNRGLKEEIAAGTTSFFYF